MKKYHPSSEFTGKVMTKVRSYERECAEQSATWRDLLNFRLMRWVVPCFAALLGLLQLMRLYFNMIMPGACI